MVLVLFFHSFDGGPDVRTTNYHYSLPSASSDDGVVGQRPSSTDITSIRRKQKISEGAESSLMG